MIKKKIGFTTIFRNRKISERLIKTINEAYLKNNKLFRRDIPHFKFIFCDNEEEFKKESKYYYFPHAAGTVLRDLTIVIKSQEFLKRSDKQYKQLIDHEMNHVFWNAIYKTTKPVWIMEGLACLIEERQHLTTKQVLQKIKNLDENILKYRYLDRDFDTVEKIQLNYSVWFLFIKYLIKENPRKLILFMDDLSRKNTKSNYKRLFKKYFGESIKSSFKKFKNG